MRTILLEIALALGLTLSGALAVWVHMHKQVALAQEATKQAQDDLKAVQATQVLREATRATSDRRAASARVSLHRATTAPAAADWAAAPVPKGVQDALCAAVRCADPAASGMSDAASTPAP